MSRRVRWICRCRRRSSPCYANFEPVITWPIYSSVTILKVVRALAHRVVVLRNGKVVEEGDADAIFQHPREEYTRSLMQAAFDLDAV